MTRTTNRRKVPAMGTAVHYVVIGADKVLAFSLDCVGRMYEYAGKINDIAYFMYKDTIHYRSRRNVV